MWCSVCISNNCIECYFCNCFIVLVYLCNTAWPTLLKINVHGYGILSAHMQQRNAWGKHKDEVRKLTTCLFNALMWNCLGLARRGCVYTSIPSYTHSVNPAMNVRVPAQTTVARLATGHGHIHVYNQQKLTRRQCTYHKKWISMQHNRIYDTAARSYGTLLYMYMYTYTYMALLLSTHTCIIIHIYTYVHIIWMHAL